MTAERHGERIREAQSDAAIVRAALIDFGGELIKRFPLGASYKRREDALAAHDRLVSLVEQAPWKASYEWMRKQRDEAGALVEQTQQELVLERGEQQRRLEEMEAEINRLTDGVAVDMAWIRQAQAAFDSLELIMFGDNRQRSRDDLEARVDALAAFESASAVPADVQADAALIREALGTSLARGSQLRVAAVAALDRLVAALPGTAE